MSKPKLNISCEAQNNKAVVRIDGYISSWDDIALRFKESVDLLVSSGIKDLEIYINSPGGSVFEANEIANILAAFTGTKVARLGALCASAATYIATKCDKVIASANTQYMIHKPSMGLEGNADEIEAQLKLLKNLQSQYASCYAKKTGLTVSEIETMWVQDYWMNSTEALTKKFIDEIDGNTTATLSVEQITAVKALGYKNIPTLTATATTPQPQNQNQMKDKLLLILASMQGFNLNASSSDSEVVAFVENIKAKALLADQLQAKLDAAELAKKQADINAVITVGLNNKQITAAQEAYYRKQLTADFEGTKAHIESLPKVVALSATTTTGAAPSAEDRSNWKYEDYQDKDPKALAEMAQNDEAKFRALFKAHYGREC